MSRKTRKLIWSVPLVAAVAVIGALAVFMTLAPNGVFADAAPGAPIITSVAPVADDLSTTDVVEGRTAIKIEWSVPDVGTDDPPITGYRIDAAIGVKNSQVWKTIMANTNSTATNYTHTGIKASTDPGTTVYYRVYAISAAGTGPVSAAGSTETVPQSAPDRTLNVEADADGATAIDLSWDAPRDDGGKPIIGYRIHIDPPGDIGYTNAEVPEDHEITGEAGFPDLDVIDNPNTGSDFIIIVPASMTSWTHKGLKEKRTYRYQVYAINDLGTSEEASNIDDATTSQAEEPDEPTNLRAVLDDAVVRLYWHWPASDGGSAITAFRVEVSKTSDGPGPEIDSGDAKTTNNVTDETLGAASDAYVVFNVPVSELDAASAGANVSVYDVQHNHGIPAGEEAELTYRVYAETTPAAGTLRSTDSGETEVEVADCPGTDPGTDLTCTGDSDPRTPAGNDRIPGPLPRDGVATGPAVVGSAVGYDQINLDWNPGTDLPLPVSYRVDVSTDGLKWSSRESDTRPITSPNYAHKRLKAGTNYYYRVFPVAGSQIGPASGQGDNPDMAAVVLTGPARAPGNVPKLNADAMGRAGQITLTWDPPTFEEDGRPNDGGRKITHYLISYKKANGPFPAVDGNDNVLDTAAVANENTDTTEATTYEVLDDPELPSGTKLVDVTMTMWEHKSLDADTSYRYEVRAINIAKRGFAAGLDSPTAFTGDDLLSKPLDHVDETGPAAVPAAPMYLIAEDAKDSNSDVAGDTGVLLLWSAPADPPGDDIDHYTIERKVMGEDNDSWQILVRSWPAVKSYYTDPDGPEEGQIYYYRVNASNDVGTSGWSNEYRLPMHDEPHGARPTPPATLEPASGPSATPGTAAGTATVSWTAGAGATMHWILAVKNDGTVEGYTWTVADSNSSHTLTGLESGSTYIVGIAAGKGQGASEEWSSWVFTTVTAP